MNVSSIIITQFLFCFLSEIFSLAKLMRDLSLKHINSRNVGVPRTFVLYFYRMKRNEWCTNTCTCWVSWLSCKICIYFTNKFHSKQGWACPHSAPPRGLATLPLSYTSLNYSFTFIFLNFTLWKWLILLLSVFINNFHLHLLNVPIPPLQDQHPGLRSGPHYFWLYSQSSSKHAHL